MSAQSKLHEALVQEGLYSKSFEDFQVQFASEEKQSLLHEALTSRGLYSKDAESFRGQFFPPAQQNLGSVFTPQSEEPPPTSSLADAFADGGAVDVEQPEADPPPQEDTEPMSPMIAQIIGRDNDMDSRPVSDQGSPEDLERKMWEKFKGVSNEEAEGFQEKQISNVRNYLSEERSGAKDLFINDEGEKFKEILGNLLGDDFDSYDGLTRGIVEGNTDDKRIVKLATGKKQEGKDFDWTDLIPAPRSLTYEENQEFKEMIEVHLSELPSILNGDDERFTPRQVEKLNQKIGPLLKQTMKRGAMSQHTQGDGTFPLGATRMFSPQSAPEAKETTKGQSLSDFFK